MATPEERIGRGLAMSRALVKLVESHFPQAWGGGNYDNWPIASAGLIVRATRSLAAITQLHPGAFFCDAGILLRSQYEHLVAFAWLAIDPPKHLAMWIASDAQQRVKAHNALDEVGQGLLNNADLAHFTSLAVKPFAPAVPAMAHAADEHWSKILTDVHSPAKTKYGLSGFYRVVYRMTSTYVHPTPPGINNTMASPEPGVTVVVGETILMPEVFTLPPIIQTMGLTIAAHVLGWPDRETLFRIFRENEIDPDF